MSFQLFTVSCEMDFVGKVGLVTGGSRGIGRALVSALLTSGMKVCICDVDEEAAKEFLESLPSPHRESIIFKKCDVTSFNDFKVAFEKVVSLYNRIDLVVNNAGLHDEINWRKVIDVNIVGVINGTKLGFEYMDIRKGAGGGAVVNMASAAGLRPQALHPVYSATKYAVVGLTKSYGMLIRLNELDHLLSYITGNMLLFSERLSLGAHRCPSERPLSHDCAHESPEEPQQPFPGGSRVSQTAGEHKDSRS